MPAPVELLKRVPLFSDLDKRELESIASSMKERTFDAGEKVSTEGKGGIAFFVIDSGHATVSIAGEEKAKLRPGDHFGEVALLGGTNRTATIVADEELRCYGMSSWAFRPLVEANGSVAWKLLQSIAKMVGERDRR